MSSLRRLFCVFRATETATTTSVVSVEEEIAVGGLLLAILDRVELVDARTKVCRIATESDLELAEEEVHAAEEILGRICSAIDRRDSLVNDDLVGEISGHDKVVFDDERRLSGVHDEPLDDLGGDDTLLRVEISRGLVDEIDVCGLSEGEGDGNALQLSSREMDHLLIDQILDLKRFVDVGLELSVAQRRSDLLVQQLSHRSL